MLPLVYPMDMMRRKDRQQDIEFARRVVDETLHAVLSMVDEEGNPYAIPISHARHGQVIYLHGATEGKKLRLIEKHPRVCLTCVGRTRLLSAEFSTEYESVIITGTAGIVTDEQERREGLLAIARKFSPDHMREAEAYIERSGAVTTVIRVTIESWSAKAKLPKKTNT